MAHRWCARGHRIDDIEDNSHFRRGQPAAHKVFGEAHVINCGNFVYFLALKECMDMGNPAATQIFVGTEGLLSLTGWGLADHDERIEWVSEWTLMDGEWQMR